MVMMPPFWKRWCVVRGSSGYFRMVAETYIIIMFYDESEDLFRVFRGYLD